MKGNYLWICVLVVPVLALPAQGSIFSKKPKADPNTRVPQLLFQVKFEPDEKKRAAAAEELRDFDTSKFSEIAPILTDVLQNDKSANVRFEATHTLSRIRPVTLTTAQALETTSKKDASMRVRVQAWTGLRMIHLAGAYPQAPKDAKPGTDSPMLVNNPGKNPATTGNQGVVILPYNPSAPAQAGQPMAQPLIVQPVSQPAGGKMNPTVNMPRPMPSGPGGGGFSTAIPTSGQRVNPPMTVEEGPALGPPPLPRN
jgi:hypothetical protein